METKLEEKINNPRSCLTETLQIINETAKRLGFEVEKNELVDKISSTAESHDIQGTYMLKSGNQEYEVSFKRFWNHEFGDGGKDIARCTLTKNTPAGKEDILGKESYVEWTTTCDDFEDYETGRENYMELYQENQLAREVFEQVREKTNLK
jgi:hypothetical protein